MKAWTKRTKLVHNIFKCILLKKKDELLPILDLVPEGPTDNESALVEVQNRQQAWNQFTDVQESPGIDVLIQSAQIVSKE